MALVELSCFQSDTMLEPFFQQELGLWVQYVSNTDVTRVYLFHYWPFFEINKVCPNLTLCQAVCAYFALNQHHFQPGFDARNRTLVLHSTKSLRSCYYGSTYLRPVPAFTASLLQLVLAREKSSALVHRSRGNTECLSTRSTSSYVFPYIKPFIRVEWACRSMQKSVVCFCNQKYAVIKKNCLTNKQ